MPSQLKNGLKILGKTTITLTTLPFIPTFIRFFLEFGNKVGIFIRNLYFFVEK